MLGVMGAVCSDECCCHRDPKTNWIPPEVKQGWLKSLPSLSEVQTSNCMF